MKFEVEATGKNIEQAIENALFELKAPREDCDIKILDEGGFFKKAKVFVCISEEERAKYQKKAENRAKLAEAETFSEKKINEAENVYDSKPSLLTKDNIDEVKSETEKLVKTAGFEKEYDSDGESEKQIGISFLKGLCEKAKVNCEIECKIEADEIFFEIVGYNAENLIGYRGEALNSLQYILTILTTKTNRHAKRVRLDIGGYRQRREETLISLAKRIGAKVEKTHHACKLEPMSPNERRIIHTALQNHEFVTTISKGEEPHRYIVVIPKETDSIDETTESDVSEDVDGVNE